MAPVENERDSEGCAHILKPLYSIWNSFLLAGFTSKWRPLTASALWLRWSLPLAQTR